MSSDGINQFLDDLELDPLDPVTLVISFYMDAKNMGEYTQTEFVRGFKKLG